MNKSRNRFRWFPYLLSQYLWLVIVASAGYLFISKQYTRVTGSFSSRNVSAINASEDPLIFVHLTDVHVNHVVGENAENFKKAISYINKIMPDITFVTGDLVDNFPYKDFPKYGSQQIEDWKIYWSMISNFSRDQFVDIPGNHDEFGLFEFLSSSHHYINGKNISYDDFSVSKRVMKLSSSSLHFIYLNPYIYPSAHPPFVFWPRIDTHFLDLVEKQLENVKDNDEVVFFCHYPLNLYFNFAKSSNKRSINDIIGNGKFGYYYLSGHLHPKRYVIQHHEKSLEIVGSDLKEHHKFGVFSFDNGRFVYHSVNATKPGKFFITNPIPTDQLTPRQMFGSKDSVLRVRAYTNSSPNITVSGSIDGKLDCRPAKTTGFVCSLPYHVEENEARVSFHGDMENNEINFITTIQSKQYIETLYDSSVIWPYSFVMIIVWILVMYIVIPTPAPKFMLHYDLWISGQITDHHWWQSILFGFIFVKHRISKLPMWIRIVLLSLAIWPVFLPIVFIEIEGHIGYIFSYGYINGGKIIYALWGQVHMLLYLLIVLIPAILVASGLSISNPFKYAVIFDIFVYLASFLGLKMFIKRYLFEATGFTCAPLSPCFVFFPVSLLISIFSWRMWCSTAPQSILSIPTDGLLGESVN